jgi:hypothetical protein
MLTVPVVVELRTALAVAAPDWLVAALFSTRTASIEPPDRLVNVAVTVIAPGAVAR